MSQKIAPTLLPAARLCVNNANYPGVVLINQSPDETSICQAGFLAVVGWAEGTPSRAVRVLLPTPPSAVG